MNNEYQPITLKDFYAYANVCEINEFLPLNRQNYQIAKAITKIVVMEQRKIREIRQ